MIRMSKITALIVAVASVTSIIPATAVSADTKLEALQGTMENVQAFAGGKYIFEGYKGDTEENGLYYFNGNKDVNIEDKEDSIVKYGMNYINFKDDEGLFNLVTGKVEDDTAEDKREYLQNKFKSSVLKKVDRYNETKILKPVEQISDMRDGTEPTGQLAKNSFGEVWFEYSIENENAKDKDKESYRVYLSETGKYIDVSETLNITHFNTKGEKIKLNKVSDLKKYNYKISPESERTLLVDNENIYRIFSLESTENTEDNKMYAQKISKAQGDKKHGAYIPKSVTTYEIGDLKVENLLANPKVTARVLKNSLYIITPKESSITMEKYDLKRIKEHGESKNRLEKDKDFDNIKNEDMKDFDIDALGNLWVLNKGKIQKVVGDKLTTMYTVDRTMNKLSVFSDNDLVAWNTENEIYSTVNSNSAKQETAKAEDKEKTQEVVKGWVKNSNGTWSFDKADGSKAMGWLNDNGNWYMLDSMGIMQTGWTNSGASWYYLQSNGAMKTGWVNDNGTWYYLNASGAMVSNTTVDGYKLGANGAWIR